MTRAPLTDNARLFRRQMWLVTIVGLLALLVAVAGVRGSVPVGLGIVGGVLFGISIISAGVLGLKMHRQALEDRELAARRSMIVMMAETLGAQDDDALRKIRDKGGLAGEAAELILKNRHKKANEQVR